LDAFSFILSLWPTIKFLKMFLRSGKERYWTNPLGHSFS